MKPWDHPEYFYESSVYIAVSRRYEHKFSMVGDGTGAFKYDHPVDLTEIILTLLFSIPFLYYIAKTYRGVSVSLRYITASGGLFCISKIIIENIYIFVGVVRWDPIAYRGNCSMKLFSAVKSLESLGELFYFKTVFKSLALVHVKGMKTIFWFLNALIFFFAVFITFKLIITFTFYPYPHDPAYEIIFTYIDHYFDIYCHLPLNAIYVVAFSITFIFSGDSSFFPPAAVKKAKICIFMYSLAVVYSYGISEFYYVIGTGASYFAILPYWLRRLLQFLQYWPYDYSVYYMIITLTLPETPDQKSDDISSLDKSIIDAEFEITEY